tara:strand:+ start:557 stop:691 length:135 start_codon:yes stop_codon:yes gene_type:complete
MEFLVFILGLILGAALAAAWFGQAMNELSVREFKQLKKEVDKCE